MECSPLRRRMILSLLAVLVCLSLEGLAVAQKLDAMSLDRWAKLRESERYQLKIADKYYRASNWKVALSEYEKYLTLYESSEAGPHAQLRWSICHVKLRKANTAIKDGFLSVIDYWPDSPEAPAAAYYIANTYKSIGQIRSAKKAYKSLLSKYDKHLVASYAINDLIAIADIEKDVDAMVELYKNLTFDIQRNKLNNSICVSASQKLSTHYFYQLAFDEAVKSLETTYTPEQLTAQVVAYARGPIGQMTGVSKTKAKGDRLAAVSITYVRGKMPTGASEEEKKVAKQHWLMVADLTAVARQVKKVPDVYEQVLKTYGNDDAVLSLLATWYKGQNSYDEARATYRRYTDKIKGLSEVAYSHRQQSKLDPAIAVYNQLLGLDAENVISWKAQIAATYRSFKKYKEAIDVYLQLTTEDLANADSWRYQIASAHQDAGQFKQAIGYYRQCTNFPTNYQQMAYCHRRLKEHKEAILLYNQVLGGHPASAPWALYQIAGTREEAGQKELAIKAFQQVCKRFPKDGHASRAHAHLQSVYKISITLGGSKDNK